MDERLQMMEDMDEERERQLRRRERIEKMHKEKQRQIRMRRRMKIVFTTAVSSFVIIMVLSIAVTAFKKNISAQEQENQGKDKFSQEIAEGNLQASLVQNDVLAIKEKKKEKEEQPEEISETYDFRVTSDTVLIYSEEVISSNAILVDESSNTIVASKGAKERISPASMTKVLTVLVAAENLTEEQLDETFVMTQEITDYGYVNDCSSVGFMVGEEISVRDLFYGTILPSGSDAAVGLATYIAGSHEAFVEMMNEKLNELGIAESSHITNCVGLYDEEHYSTVYDMSIIMKAAIQNELCKEVLAEHNYTTASTTEHPEGINISNWFLRRIEDKDTGGEVLCAKTGYVMQSKNCAVSYGTFADGKPYICVTAGSSSSWRCIYDHVEIYNRYITI